eukprot:COSAG02_NODE_21746_length_776_cov_1.450517_1_plen_88_part_10
MAFVEEGDPGGSCDLPPCVEAPQMMNAGVLPPVQHTSASLLFQSHPAGSFCRTVKFFRAALPPAREAYNDHPPKWRQQDRTVRRLREG